jgi:hypothetical protein
MEKELIILITGISALIAAFVTALGSYISTRIASKTQLSIAKENTQKELLIQENNALENRLKSQVELKRNKLEQLHVILSEIYFANSQTVSFIQSSKAITLHALDETYQENINKANTAQSISAIYYPNFLKSLEDIRGEMSCFWGFQRDLIQSQTQTNKKIWDDNLNNVLKSAHHIKTLADTIHIEIINQAEILDKSMNNKTS